MQFTKQRIGQNISVRRLIGAMLVFLSFSTFGKPLTIADFVKPSAAKQVKISPDGKHLALVLNENNEDVLAIFDTRTRQVLDIISIKGHRRSVNDYHWVNDQRIVYSIKEHYGWDKQKRDTGGLYAIDIDGRNLKVIFGFRAGKNRINAHHEIIDLLPDDPKHILIAAYRWKRKSRNWITDEDADVNVYRLDLYTGERELVDKLPAKQARGMTDTKGRLRFSIAEDSSGNSIIHFRDVDNGKWKLFKLFQNDLHNFYPVTFNKDDTGVYFTANKKGKTRGLYLLDLGNGKVEHLYTNPQVDLSGFLFNFEQNRIVGVATEIEKPEYFYIDDNDPMVKLHQSLLAGFIDDDVVLTSRTSDGRYAVVLVYSDKNSGDYFLYESKTNRVEFMMSRRGWLPLEEMAEMKSVSFTSKDGMFLHGYLSTPISVKNKSLLPLVVVPHGGPHQVRDYWGFDEEVQLLTSRGYAVLQVNFRGSGGFGEAFEEAGYHQWGMSMQDDITTAVKNLIKNGTVDPARICIYGHSFGGYSALMSVIREPDLYQCAIGSMGIYDLNLMYEKGDIAERENGVAYLKKVLGEDKSVLEQQSPVNHVENIRSKILLIHGGQDDRAPLEHAERMRDAMQDAGKPLQMLELRSEGHGYQDPENRIKVYNAVLTFLDQNIGQNNITVK